MYEVALIIAVVIAMLELVKKTGLVANKYLPVIALIIGVTSGLLYIDGDVKEQILTGLMIGLSASGLFDQTKIVTKKDEK